MSVARDLPARLGLRPPLAVASAAVAATAAAGWLAVSRDHSEDVTSAVSQLPWTGTAAVFALVLAAVAHFVCAAAALRGVSGRPLHLRDVTLTQVAAAAANRVVPNGVAGAGVNARYLVRSGLTAGAAGSALAALAVLGGASDAAYLAGITTFGPSIGIGGARGELQTLSRSGVAAGQRHAWLLLSVIAAVLITLVIRARGRLVSTAVRATRNAVSHARGLLSQRRQLATAALASMATTAVLGGGFALSVRVWGEAAHPLPTGALVALYGVAAAAGGSTPVPAFTGLTEAALIGGLTLGGYTASSSAVAVITFRVITFWLPVPAGLWAARRLRRAHLL